MSILISLSTQFHKDIILLKKEEGKILAKVLELISDIMAHPENPGVGLGKPELLKGELNGYYSRRITEKHRLIYKVEKNILYIVSCYGHYDDK